tara:strand:- start:4592 stop:5623 length:1032 start_codon:yes stop_codon:yes gene_type:complete
MPRKPQLTKAKANQDIEAKRAILKTMPTVSEIDPLKGILPSAPKVPPALARLRTAPQYDESWFSTYDNNPDAAKMFREQMLLKKSDIQRRRSVMEEQRRKDRLAAAKVKHEDEKRKIIAERQQKEKEARDKKVYEVCQQLKQTLDIYPGKTTALEKVAMKKPELFRAIHSKFKSNIAAEKERVDNIIKNDCSLKRDPEFLSETYQYKIFAKMEKIIAQFRKEMCAKMKDHIIKKYSAETNRTIQNARLKYPAVYQKHLPKLKENMQRIITGLDELCPADTTNRYFDENLVSGLMDPIVMQMQREIDAAASAAPSTTTAPRVGGRKRKTQRRNKQKRRNTRKKR